MVYGSESLGVTNRLHSPDVTAFVLRLYLGNVTILFGALHCEYANYVA